MNPLTEQKHTMSLSSARLRLNLLFSLRLSSHLAISKMDSTSKAPRCVLVATIYS
jgi:hypothetical protein